MTRAFCFGPPVKPKENDRGGKNELNNLGLRPASPNPENSGTRSRCSVSSEEIDSLPMQKLYVEAREFEYRGLTEDRRGIIIPLGIVWTFPSLRTIKTDAYARPVDGLESYAPKHVKRITFE